MAFFKYDTKKNNVILEVSTAKFTNLKNKEKQIDIPFLDDRQRFEVDGRKIEKLDIQPWYYYKIQGNKIVSSTEDDIDKFFGGNWPKHSRNKLVFVNTEKVDDDDDDD